ncbi:ABC transporter ATP-binding protein, partial [Streptomyces sp. NPDC039022]
MKGLAAQGRTVFVSSHLMSEMALTAEHLIVIGQGRLLADTSMAQFIRENSRAYVRMRSPERERLLDVLRDAGHPASPAGEAVEVDGVSAADLGELAARHRIVLHELSPQQASLEEAFMQLTAGSVEYHAHSAAPRPAAPEDGLPDAPPPPGAPGAPPPDSPPGGWGAGWRDQKRGS